MHELVDCERFMSEKNQPFFVFISLEALMLMSIHAHIHHNEIIGFVSGYRLKSKNKRDVLIIHECVPC